MQRIISLLQLKPILYGLIGMIIGGLSFPSAGVIVVQNGLISMRYMLMHGMILGGVLAVVLDIPMLLAVIPVNIILVLIMVNMNHSGRSLSVSGTVMMVSTMGLASLMSHVADVPAKDMLDLLWGSPFALTSGDLIILAVIGLIQTLYCIIFFRPISMIFFDRETALSMGVPVRAHDTAMMLFASLSISVAMRVLGALLVDALLVLPVSAAGRKAQSLSGLFLRSAATGLILSVSGYMIALLWNLPVSGTLSLLAALIYLINLISRRKK